MSFRSSSTEFSFICAYVNFLFFFLQATEKASTFDLPQLKIRRISCVPLPEHGEGLLQQSTPEPTNQGPTHSFKFSGRNTCGKRMISTDLVTSPPTPRERGARGLARAARARLRAGPLPSRAPGPRSPSPRGAEAGPVPAGCPAPCPAAGGPAASWGSWSAAAAPCPGTCHYSSWAAGYWPR